MEVTSLPAGGRAAHAAAGRGFDIDNRPRSLDGQRLRATLSAAGSGVLLYDSLAVTRGAGDVLGECDGQFAFVRDLDDGRFWSATWSPTAGAPQRYEARFSGDRARLVRQECDVLVETEVHVRRDADVELRRLTLVNLSDRRRRLEVTSYLEWVLQDAAADAAHPAFSKLFVETEYLPRLQAVVARRRPRDPKQRVLCGAHWIAGSSGRSLGDGAEFETSRAAFIGRGRSLRSPHALVVGRRLSGHVGPVLDPIASLRRAFILHPGESAVVVFATAARATSDELVNLLRDTRTGGLDEHGRSIAANGRQQAAPSDSAERPTVRDAHTLRYDAPHAATRASTRRRLQQPPQRSPAAAGPEPLRFDNGIGGFTPSGHEYVIRLAPDADGNLVLPPLPWTHVVANPQAGFIATERGAGYTWTANSRENRLTPWSNDPVADPHGEALYIRDDARGVYWSPLPGPAGTGAACEVRYGFGYAQYAQTCGDLDQRMVQFVPADDPVKISRLRLANLAGDSRRLDLFAYAQLALGDGTRESARGVRTWLDGESGALFAANPARELSHRVAFAKLVAPAAAEPLRVACNRQEFVGQFRDLAEPHAVTSLDQLSNRSETVGGDACFALQATITLEPQGAAEYWVLLGEAETEDEARRIIQRYSHAEQLDAALDEVRQFWQQKLSAVSIQTPSPAMDFMVNGWLPYQNISCRLWGRSAYYQSGGAYGFRDQLQDAASLVYHWPELTRQQILRHAASQFVEGDVLHWWHPPNNRGIRTRFSDDLLWLPLLASEYCDATGDRSLWDETAPYVAGPQLAPGEQERFLAAVSSGQSGTVYEHCCRAIDRSLVVGVHGLPLMGCGDWNDGMNRIGEGGRGESVWMGFFLYQTLERFIPVCQSRGDAARVARYREHQRRLREALNGVGWDGQWYRRAFFDDGEAVGSAAAEECQIDALAQAWAVLSGAGEPEKAAQAVAAVDERLVDARAGLIRLLDPPFDRLRQDPGYIKGYVPGVRENGGQYTHGVLWFIRALAQLGRGTRAVELLDMINPVHHGRTPQEVAVYQAEPYVVAADVYSQPPHAGRGGWTWYTGSAGWMWRVAVESILGFSVRDGRTLLLNPAISSEWPACGLQYRLPDGATVYHIRIENPDNRQTGVSSATLDGRAVVVNNGVAELPLVADGQTHQATVRL